MLHKLGKVAPRWGVVDPWLGQLSRGALDTYTLWYTEHAASKQMLQKTQVFLKDVERRAAFS